MHSAMLMESTIRLGIFFIIASILVYFSVNHIMKSSLTINEKIKFILILIIIIIITAFIVFNF